MHILRNKNDLALDNIVKNAAKIKKNLDIDIHESLTNTIYTNAVKVASKTIKISKETNYTYDKKLDEILTSRIWGFPIMFFILAFIFWLTIVGANYPSAMLADMFFAFQDVLESIFNYFNAPWWFTGFFVHGIYRGLAWVTSVMLPPMMIFFPAFTLLEDFGYLPRVAFNLDRLFKSSGAHGKMALTMSMGFGCNAAGVVATRIIDSPRERLIAIITNNFVPCNGRWPTLIMVSTIFISALFPAGLGALAAAGTLVLLTVIGVVVTLLVSFFMSKTVLKGEASTFTLELPPYRKPKILQVLYTSMIDRTIFVLWRAVVMAAPCGAIAWLLGNIIIDGNSLMFLTAEFLQPAGYAIGLDGVILLAYIIAIPANEIVIPTILMAYMNMDRMIDITDLAQLKTLFIVDHGWTIVTAICIMLFSVLHNPCSTTIWTIYKETQSKKWTTVSALLPLAIAIVVCFTTAQILRSFL